MSAGDWMAVSVMLPLLVAAAVLVLPRKAAPVLGVTALAGATLASGVVIREVALGGAFSYTLSGWDAPLGIELRADGLSAIMLLTTAAVGLFGGLYAAGAGALAGPVGRPFRQDLERPPEDRRGGDETRYLWTLVLFFIGSQNALFLSGDAFNLYVSLELMGLSAAALVCLGALRGAMAAGIRYLLVSLLGSLLYLLGVALLYGSYGTLELAGLAEAVEPSWASWSALALVVSGMALKTGLVPLHFWISPAYSGAPAPAAAVVSGLAVKASFYIALRFWFEVYGGDPATLGAYALGVLGAVAVIWGGWRAIRQSRLAALLAYSSVSQAGYLFLVFPLAGIGGVSAGAALGAYSAVIYLAFSHALAKAAMFMAAGTLALAVGSDRLAGLGGVADHRPLSVAALCLGGVTLMGLPPSGGFTTKVLLVEAAVERGEWWIAAVVLVGGLIAALYVARFLGAAFGSPEAIRDSGQGELEHEEAERNSFRRAPKPLRGRLLAMETVAVALALASFFTGLVSGPLLDLVEAGAPFGGGGG